MKELKHSTESPREEKGAIRTDLALEAAEALQQQEKRLPDGTVSRTYTRHGIQIHAVEITTPQGEQALGKPCGKYLTISIPPLSSSAQSCDEQVEALAEEIRALLPQDLEDKPVLVAGLGNTAITPDAIGPKTARQILATRHLAGDWARQVGLDMLRPVAAIAPGVLGQTGIETSEIIASVAKAVQPAAVIAVDALAARGLSRLGTTIQLSNTGISPGAGVLNQRQELSRRTLGVEVLSLGIPTVVDAMTMAADLVDGGVPTADKAAGQMMVTPKDIDLLVDRGAHVMSMALNRALQPELSTEDLSYLLS